MFTVFLSLFVFAAACYLLFITSEPLEDVGGRIGKLLKIPEDVIASTFQATATSGPEIVMAIIAATPFVGSEIFSALTLGERASSGTLNMAFSAMDNLLGIGAVAMIFLIRMGKVDPNEVVPAKPSTIIGLVFYVFPSGFFSIFLYDGVLTFSESWTLMGIGILFIASQFIIPPWIHRKWPDEDDDENECEKIITISGEAADRCEIINSDTLRNLLKNNKVDIEVETKEPIVKFTEAPANWGKSFFFSCAVYAFLVYALIIFVRECLGATFNMAIASPLSVGGILIMFTSYVSSFPEFMMSYRYVIADKKSELLGMLFGSNVIDLAFAGFRSIWLKESMEVYTTGLLPGLLPVYIWLLPIIAILILVSLTTKNFKWKHAYPLVVFYLVYIISGFVLL